MNLSKRGKWLTGIAALIAAYVAFGPKDSDSVEPAKAAARPAAHTTHAVTSTVSVPVARSLLALAHRVVDPTAAGALFAIVMHAWYVRHPSDIPAPTEPKPRTPQINFSSTEVAGDIGGLIFVVGSVFIVAVGLPSVIWFMFAGTVAGCFLAWGLVSWYTSHPKWGLPENRIILR